MKTLGQRLAAVRRERNLSQSKLAARVGCSPSTISDIESGRIRKTSNLLAMARVLGVSALWLESGRGSRTPVSGGAYVVADSLEDLARQLVDRGPDEVGRLWAAMVSEMKIQQL